MKFKFLFLVLLCFACGVTMGVAHADTFTVTKLADTDDGVCDSDCSLREAIGAANTNGNTINDYVYLTGTLFSTPQTITLDSNLGPLTLTDGIFLIGPFPNYVTVSGGDATMVFDITGGSSLFQTIRITHGLGSTGSPGGIRLNGGSVSLLYCTVENNKGANGFFGRKGSVGGISVSGGTLSVSSSLIANNTGGNGGSFADGGAGGIEVSTNGSASIGNSTVANNQGGAGGNGVNGTFGSPDGGDGGAGGIINFLSLTINNSTIAYNIGGLGGQEGTPAASNGAIGVGGVHQKGAFCTTANSIYAYNGYSNSLVARDFGGSPTTDNGYNLITTSFGSSGFSGPGNLLDVDPILGFLADNGGLTPTTALKSGSPAINAGDPNYTSSSSYDQRGGGFPRIFGGRVDIGAFESQEVALSINHGTMLIEGDTGTKSISFTVTLSGASNQSVSVNYATQNATAIAPADYTATSGTLSFAAGETSKTIMVTTKGDTLDEADEFFRVNLSAPTNAILGEATGIGLIEDDDAAPLVSINNVSVTEGNSGTVNATFTITLSTASGQVVTINAIPYNGTARSPGDYTSGGARLVFQPGETSKPFSVPVKGDLLDEPNEVFYVILSSAVNCTIKPGAGRGIGTITDDDAPPSISIDDVRIGEGNSGQRTAAFRLKLSAPSGQVVRVTAATRGLSATAGSDYTELAPTQIAFTTGNIFAYARVLINGDTLNEADETFNVNLSSPIAATISDNQALGTILNDDSAPSLTISDASITEGNSGNKVLNFTVTLSKASGQTVTVNYATADGIARSTSDYMAQNGALSFAAGQTTKTISVVINGDTTFEGDETLFVLLSNATVASIGRARGTGTIINDDTSG